MKIRVFMQAQVIEVDDKFTELTTIPDDIDGEINQEILTAELEEIISAKYPMWQEAETMDGEFLL